MTTGRSTTAPPATPALDLDAITDGATGWDREWIADLPGNLPSSTYLAPDLAGRAQREIAALLADVDRLLAEVRWLRAELDAVPPPVGDDVRHRNALDAVVALARHWASELPGSPHRYSLRELAQTLRETIHRAGGGDVLDEPTGAEFDKAFDAGGPVAPTVYALPAEPPPEVTELWDRIGDRWEPDTEPEAAGYWYRVDESGVVVEEIPFGEVVFRYGRLSTVPPAGTKAHCG